MHRNAHNTVFTSLLWSPSTVSWTWQYPPHSDPATNQTAWLDHRESHCMRTHTHIPQFCLQRRCGGRCYSPLRKTCRNGVLCDIGKQRCGRRCYSPLIGQTCTNGVVCNAGRRACGSICFEPSDGKVCRDGQVVCEEARCGDQCYEPSVGETCTEGVVCQDGLIFCNGHCISVLRCLNDNLLHCFLFYKLSSNSFIFLFLVASIIFYNSFIWSVYVGHVMHVCVGVCGGGVFLLVKQNELELS